MSDALANSNRKTGSAAVKSRPKQQDKYSGLHLGFLCFTLEGNELGIDLNSIRKILKPPPLTWVPRAEPHILGVVSIRGKVVTLMDLRQLLGMEPSSWPRSARILLVERKGEPLGLLVDSVTSVRRVAPEDLESRASLDASGLASYALHVFRPAAGKAVVVIDLGAALAGKTE